MYCPNCSASYSTSEGFCAKCGWRLGSGRVNIENIPQQAAVSGRRKYSRALHEIDFVHWDFNHTGPRQFPNGKW